MRGTRIQILLAVLAASMLSAGCAETDTSDNSSDFSNEEEESGTVPQGTTHMENIKESLKLITSYDRASGTSGEKEAAEQIKARLEGLGYETRLQPFEQAGLGEAGKTVSGINVIAVKKPEQNDEAADILYITAHHDAKPGIQGAEDDASGVAVLLEAASQVADLHTNAEIRFATFGGEEDGRVGSRFHVEGLTEEEKSRIIGDIQLDDLGYWGSDYLKLSTVDGKPILIGDMLSEKAQHTRNVGRVIPYVKGEMSDHNSFHSHGIPSVMLGQDTFAFENHSTQDRIGILDLKRLEQTAQLVADVTAEIMSSETGSLREKAYSGRKQQTAYEVQPETVIQFDMDRNYVENMMGLSGEPVETTVNEFNDRLETFRYPVIWFGMEEPLDTLFQYRNGYLEMIEIPQQEGIGEDQEEMKAHMEASLGTAEAGGTEGGTAWSWEDKMYHKFYSLEPSENRGYHILVLNYSLGKEVRATYDLSRGIEAAMADAKEETDKKFLDLLSSIIYPEDLPLIQFSVYSDGKSYTRGLTSSFVADDNSQMEYALDYGDAFGEDGEYREYNKTICDAVHEYGHVISLNKNQVDITKQDAAMPSVFYETETYGADAYLRDFYEAFWENLDVKSGLEHYQIEPDDFVSAYGATNMSEDFADSFRMFVLSSKPEDDSTASEKIRFFYQYAEMVTRRDYIRSNLGLEETAGRTAPELEDGNYRVALDGNPTTGYSWHYTMEPEGIVSEAAAGFYQNYHERDLVGAGGTFIFDFKGEEEGTTEVVFSYERPWQQGQAADTIAYRLEVDAEGKVTGEEIKKAP